MKNAIKFFDRHFEEAICVIGFLFFVTVSVIQVFTRLIPWIPVFPWTEELARYSFVWVMFLGISWALRDAAHLRIDLLVSHLPKLGQKICGAFNNLVILGFSLFVGSYALTVVAKQIRIGQRLTATGLPMWIVTLCFLTSCILTSIRAVQRLIIDWRQSEVFLSEEEKAVQEMEQSSKAVSLPETDKAGEGQ
jgi:TRAP-type C4-dicarboxylate transport system permease small subunit